MTAIIAFNYITEILVIADTRVSYPTAKEKLKYDGLHGLRKTVPIHNKEDGNIAILGFSGEVSFAKALFRYLLVEKKLNNYQRPFVIEQLHEDIRKWIIEFRRQGRVTNNHLFQMLFAGFEPKRKIPFQDQAGKPISPSFDFRECHLYVYTVTETGNVQTRRETGSYAVIGSGQNEAPTDIEEIYTQWIGFGRGHPEHDIHRAWAVGNWISHAFETIGSRTVGGPIEILRLVPPPYETSTLWLWEPGGMTGPPPTLKVVDQSDGTILIENSKNGQEMTIYPIWHQERWRPGKLIKSYEAIIEDNNSQ